MRSTGSASVTFDFRLSKHQHVPKKNNSLSPHFDNLSSLYEKHTHKDLFLVQYHAQVALLDQKTVDGSDFLGGPTPPYRPYLFGGF